MSLPDEAVWTALLAFDDCFTTAQNLEELSEKVLYIRALLIVAMPKQEAGPVG